MLRRIVCSALVLLGSFAVLCAAHAAEETNPNKALYLRYCSSCHGSDGKGNGPLAALLTPKPTDLTLLAKNNGGKFNPLAIFQSTSGSGMNKAHGTPASPVWGEALPHGGDSDDPRAAKLKIAQIVNYLRSIQEK